MPTKFYFSNLSGFGLLGPGPTGSGFAHGWQWTNEHGDYYLSRYSGESPLVSGTLIGPWTPASNFVKALDRVYISQPLASGIISGRVSGQIRVLEGATADNVNRTPIALYVINKTGGLRGSLLSLGGNRVNNYGRDLEFATTTPRNQVIITGSGIVITTPVTGDYDDRIVFEIGYDSTLSPATPEARAVYGSQGNQLPGNNTTTTQGTAGWLSFGADFKFLEYKLTSGRSRIKKTRHSSIGGVGNVYYPTKISFISGTVERNLVDPFNGITHHVVTGHSILSNNKTVLVANLHYNQSTLTGIIPSGVSGVTWGTQQLTPLVRAKDDFNNYIHQYYLLNPETGRKDLTVRYVNTGSTDTIISNVGILEYTGVNPTKPIENTFSGTVNGSQLNMLVTGNSTNLFAGGLTYFFENGITGRSGTYVVYDQAPNASSSVVGAGFHKSGIFNTGYLSVTADFGSHFVWTAASLNQFTGDAPVQEGGTIDRYIQGTSRLQKVIFKNILAVSNIAPSTATKSNYIQGISRVSRINLLNRQGVSRISNVEFFNIQSVSRVRVSLLKNIIGNSRIQKTFSRNVQGVSRVTNFSQKNQQAISRVSVRKDVYINSVTRITGTRLGNYRQGASRINATKHVSLNGLGRITVSKFNLIQGNSRVSLQKTGNYIQGQSRVTSSKSSYINGLSRVTASTHKSISGVSRVSSSKIRSQQSLSRLSISVFKNQQGISRVLSVSAKSIQAIARLQKSNLFNISGFSRISALKHSNIGGVSRILQLNKISNNLGLARIARVKINNITGLSRVSLQNQKYILSNSRVWVRLNKNITGISRVGSSAISRSISGISSVKAPVQKNIQAISRVSAIKIRNQQGLSRITLRQEKYSVGIARLKSVFQKNQQGISNILSSSFPNFKNIIGRARVIKDAASTDTLILGTDGNWYALRIVLDEGIYTLNLDQYQSNPRSPAVNWNLFCQDNSTYHLISATPEGENIVLSVDQSSNSNGYDADRLIYCPSDSTYHRVYLVNELGTIVLKISQDSTAIKAISGISSISAATLIITRNQQGISRIAAQLNKSISSISRISRSSLNNINGISRVRSTKSNNIVGVSRITSFSQKNIFGLSRLLKSSIYNTLGRSRLSTSVNKNQQAVSRIRGSVSKSINGISRVSKSNILNINGLSRISKVYHNSISGFSRISRSYLNSISGTVRVTSQISKGIQGISRVGAALQTKHISGLSRVHKSISVNVQGVSRIYISLEKSISASSRIVKSFSNNIFGQSRLISSIHKVIQGVARIGSTLQDKHVYGLSRIVKIDSKNQQATARLQKSNLNYILGQALILSRNSQNIFGVSRISKFSNSNLLGLARIQKLGSSQNIVGIAKISSASNRSINGISRVTSLKLRSISGRAYIQSGSQIKIQSGVSRIYALPVSSLLIKNININAYPKISSSSLLIKNININTYPKISSDHYQGSAIILNGAGRVIKI